VRGRRHAMPKLQRFQRRQPAAAAWPASRATTMTIEAMAGLMEKIVKQANDLTTKKLNDKDLPRLFQAMGVALTTFQGVEDAHYLLFLKMLGAPMEEVCSVIYFSPPSFEGRRVMVDRVAQHALEEKYKNEWNALNKRLSKASEKRGRIAHYSLDFEWIDVPPVPPADFAFGEMGKPRLRPSRYNRLKDGDNPQHLLTIIEVAKSVSVFAQLRDDLNAFTAKVSLPRPRQGLGLLNLTPRPPNT
jgi:hypothetical protein